MFYYLLNDEVQHIYISRSGGGGPSLTRVAAGSGGFSALDTEEPAQPAPSSSTATAPKPHSAGATSAAAAAAASGSSGQTIEMSTRMATETAVSRGGAATEFASAAF